MRINHAQIHHDLLTALRQCTATQENLVKFNRNVRFFSGVDSALFNSTIVLLYTLYERRSDTVNFGRGALNRSLQRLAELLSRRHEVQCLSRTLIQS